MSYVQKPGEGSIFINKDKKGDKHPDRTGHAFLECPSCKHTWRARIAGWLRRSERLTDPFLSIKIEPEIKQSAAVEAAVRGAIKREFPSNELDDSIPF